MDIDLRNVDFDKLQSALTPKMSKYCPYTPTPKQKAFLLMNSKKEVLYGGAAGGGKSICQLMAALQYVDIPGYSAILFRKTYADLSLPGALIDVAKQWLMGYVDKREIRWSDKDKKFTFPSGATLSFGYLESDNDCYRYQGSEFQYIGLDEVTHISPNNYRYMFSRLRKPKNLNVPLRFRATCNPGGQYGDFYYQRFFVEGPEHGRIFIGAGLVDNPYIDTEEYTASLNELDPVEREQLLHGNWQIKEKGDMLNSGWFTKCRWSEVPTTGTSVRFWDFASTDPKKRKVKSKSKTPDWSVGFKMVNANGLYYITDIVRVQKSPRDLELLVRATAELDGYNTSIRIEQEPGSSGAITIDHYTRNILADYNCVGVLSSGSKVERATPAAAAAEAGRVLIVDNCRNMTPFFDEADAFPYGGHDDTVDGFSGAFNTFRKKVVSSAPSGIKKTGGSYWKKL